MAKLGKVVAIIAAVLVCGYLVLVYVAGKPYRELNAALQSLSTEEQVIKTFGQPDKVYYAGTEDYYEKGFSYEKRVINHKVAIYLPRPQPPMVYDTIVYIYYDKMRQVEHYFVGGT